ncbi:putative endonuclease [Desulfitispora alkaliphila]|uniref:YraN family protein n=1 Tax=Desulfitispora alkaliphila TaxID=622674 RepID=UPI003D25221D
MLKAKELGVLGERVAVENLISKGYTILEKNYRCNLGEIDIICRGNNLLLFVEVKTRKSLNCGYGQEAVTAKKQGKIRRVASYYLYKDKKLSTEVNIRFDVISIIIKEKNRVDIQHIEGAF